MAFKSGVVWVESPMGTGKTSLGQLMAKEEGFSWQTISAPGALLDLTAPLSQPLYVDEAQRIAFDDVVKVRARCAHSVVILAGTSCMMIPFTCSTHLPANPNICKKCLTFACCNAESGVTCKDGEHSFADTVSATLEDGQRIGVDDLVADDKELSTFLELYNSVHCHPILPPETPVVFRELTGGMLGLTMALLLHVSTKYRTPESGERRHLDAAELRCGMWSQEFLGPFLSPTGARCLQFAASSAEKSALVNLLRCNVPPAPQLAESLRKRGFLKKDGDFRSLLHKVTAQRYLFQKAAHEFCPWSSVPQLVTHILRNLTFDDIFEGAEMQHEDAVNRKIGTILAASLSSSATYVGPAKVVTAGRLAQCDHVVYGHELGTIIIEVLLEGRERLEHTTRPNRDYKCYNASIAVTLDILNGRVQRKTKDIHNFDLACPVGSSSHLFCVEVGGSKRRAQYVVFEPVDVCRPSKGLRKISKLACKPDSPCAQL